MIKNYKNLTQNDQKWKKWKKFDSKSVFYFSTLVSKRAPRLPTSIQNLLQLMFRWISCCVLPIKNKFSQNKNGLPDRASIKSHEDFQKLKEKYTTHYCCTPQQELSCASCVFAPSFFNASLNKFLQDYLAPFNVSVKKVRLTVKSQFLVYVCKGEFTYPNVIG